jgi:uncharacterized glyoxalase superfamily protein PhnB
MAGKKKDKEGRKAAKKAKKAEKKARKKAAKEKAKTPAPASKAAVGRAKAPARKVARRVVRGDPSAPPPSERRQPQTLRLRSASPSLTVNDIEKSLAFYCDILGFTVKERWKEDGVLKGAELVAGRVSFWLSQDDWKKGRDRVKGQGLRIYCTTTQDVDALAEGIKARGGTLAEGPKDRPWGGRDFAVTDPDGLAITIANEA